MPCISGKHVVVIEHGIERGGLLLVKALIKDGKLR